MIEVEDATGTWPSKCTHRLFAFTEAVGIAIARLRGGQVAWCPDMWATMGARRHARMHHGRA